ncbi:MAG: DUF393 domain-containing protein [Flavobacterium sp.]|nr:DUF393 domain-containing protein [Flavobacterium sp.]
MELSELPAGKKIVLFDGVCNLCNSSVRYIINRDKKDVFRFAALQSDIGQKILRHIGADEKYTDSIVLYEPGQAYYYKSSAAIEIAKHLGSIHSIGIIFKLIPSFLRNPIYDYVARNRYKWYGKTDECAIPTPRLQKKFLS